MDEKTILRRLDVLTFLAVLGVVMLLVIGLTNVNIGVLTIPAGKQYSGGGQQPGCHKEGNICYQGMMQFPDGCEISTGGPQGSTKVGTYECVDGKCVFKMTTDCKGRQCIPNYNKPEKGECVGCYSFSAPPLIGGPEGGTCRDDSGEYQPTCEDDVAVNWVCKTTGGRLKCATSEEACLSYQKCVVMDMSKGGGMNAITPIPDVYHADCLDKCRKATTSSMLGSREYCEELTDNWYVQKKEICRGNTAVHYRCDISSQEPVEAKGVCKENLETCQGHDKCFVYTGGYPTDISYCRLCQYDDGTPIQAPGPNSKSCNDILLSAIKSGMPGQGVTYTIKVIYDETPTTPSSMPGMQMHMCGGCYKTNNPQMPKLP